MTLQEMRAKMSALSPELEVLAKKENRAAEDETRLDAILAEINDLGPKIEREAAIAKAAEKTRAMSEPAGTIAARMIPGDGAERLQARDMRSPMQRFLGSDEYKRAKAHPKGLSDPLEVGSFHKRASGLEFHEGDAPLRPDEVRALITSGSAGGSFLMPDVLPGIHRGLERDLRMRDVLASGSTNSDAVTVMQENVFTNAAVEVIEATIVTDGAKPESSLTFTEATFPVRWIAHWVPITRQMLDDLPMMQSYVEQRLIDGIRRREDAQFLNGNGTPPNLTGLLVTSGIQVLDATYFTGAPVVNAAQSAENFNRILRAKTVIRTVGLAQANFVVLNPVDVEQFLTYGDANRGYYGPGPFTGARIPEMWGLTVVESENIAADTALVGDGMMAAVIDRMDARIYTTDSHSDFFIRNILTILAEERVALPVFRPAAFAKVTLVA